MNKGVIRMGKTESFEARLYLEMKQINPQITIRQLSRAMGKTDGYFASVTTQKVGVSLDALVKLNQYLECRVVLIGETSADGIRSIQRTIATEVLSRLKQKTEDSGDFWEVIKSQIEAPASKPKQLVEPLPFSWTRY
jgi:hypothetical protein